MNVKSNLDRAAFATAHNDFLETGMSKIELATLMIAQGILANPESNRISRDELARNAAELAASFLEAAEKVAEDYRNRNNGVSIS